MVGPCTPPLSRPSRPMKDTPPFFSSSLWQPRHRRLRIGSTLSSKNCCWAAAQPTRSTAALMLLAHAELIARTDHLSVVHYDFEHLLALHGMSGVVLQRGDNLLRVRVDDVAGRGI